MSEETPDPEEIAEDIGKTHYFNGTKLEPFSFERQVAAQRIGNGASTLESAVTIIYLCTLPPQAVDAARGNEIQRFRERMWKWANAQKITLRNKRGDEAIRVANAIFDELEKVDFESDTTGGTSSPNASS